jgi:hypothetical protein
MKIRIIFMMIMSLVGCAETPDGFKRASDACATFGGLQYHYVFPTEQIHCLNGTIINKLGK